MEESPTIILLHGGVINRHMWGPVVDILAECYDCISIDLPARGELMDEEFSIDRGVDRVIEVLDDLVIENS
ncbi:MAG: alpha/beta hydrolase, partial [Acidimicrobiia bacterium]